MLSGAALVIQSVMGQGVFEALAPFLRNDVITK